MIEHHIQREIIMRLAKAKSLRFSELKPEDIESNAFMYHLNQLRTQKLVDKTDDGYQLSDDGLAYIDGFSFNTLKPRKQPKIISILVIRQGGKYLLAKRKYQPYIGQYMFVSGKQHIGEGPSEHAQRELSEKIGMDLELKRRGLSDIRIYHGDKIITHVTAHIYEGETSSDVLPADTAQFEFHWITADDEQVKMLPGTREIMRELDTNKELFFISLDEQDE